MAKDRSTRKPIGARNTATMSSTLRARVWIELGGTAALTDAGADLLEQIQACGSLSEGARRLKFSYRRAWVLIDTMNRHWPEPLVDTAIGGNRGGGTKVTPYGAVVLRSYRDLQIQLEHFIDQAAGGFSAATRI